MLLEFRSRNELELDQSPGIETETGESGASQPAVPAALRLCYISNPNIIHTRRWVNWFARRGHSVCVLADVPPKEPWSEVPVIDLSQFFHAPVIRFPVWAVWLRVFIRQWCPDVLHAHRVNSAGWLAAASGFHPYVVTPWGSDVFIGPERSWVARLLARYTLQHADKVTALSQAISDRVIELGAQQGKTTKIFLGVDLDVFHPRPVSEQASAELLRSLSMPATARLVYSPRAIHPIYNQDIILQAIPRVRQRFPDVCFVFTTYNTDPQYKRALDSLVGELRLGDSVRWLPAASTPMEMAERYHSSAAVLSVPSSDGGTPVTAMEAMACARPVVCSDLPALHEFITEGENGWLVPVRQPEPLADAIIRVLENPGQAELFGQRARQVVEERVSLDVQMQRMEVIYRQLVEAKG